MKTPAAERKTLVLLAGAVWSIVGVGLIVVGLKWLISGNGNIGVSLAIGVAVGAAVHFFGFSKLVTTNLKRIYSQSPGKSKVCVFAFQNRRSYLMIAIMILMGYIMRHSPIPKIYLAPMYLTIGFALLLSSIRYYGNAR
ncbi:MAG: hypothetical protein ABIK83_01800 [Candidatus Zixiibacteriota bacterium]